METPRTRLDPVPADSQLTCSFCGKARDKVDTMVAGVGQCICGECIQLCDEILIAADKS